MKLDDEALPIHEDAEVKVRPRIFFEGNLFLDVRPGTPDSPEADSGYTIPASQTSAPVQIDQVLGTLQTNTRKDLQKLLVGYGDAINGQPQPGEDDDQGPEVQGLTAAEALNESLDYSSDALRGAAIVNQALLGSEAARPLEADRQPAEGLRRARLAARTSSRTSITNFNITMGALASEQGNLRDTIAELPQVLEAANPTLDNLNAAFPPTRAWALEMIPGVRETPATIEAGFPWMRQTRALLSKPELQGLVNVLQPAISDFAEFTEGQVDLLPKLDAFNRCQLEVVLPTRRAAHPGRQPHHRAAQLRGVLPVAGRRSPASRRTSTATARTSASRRAAAPTRSRPRSVGTSARCSPTPPLPPLGTRPAKAAKPPYKPNVPCHTNPVPDLSNARRSGAAHDAPDQEAGAGVHLDPGAVRRSRSGSAATSCRTSASTCRPGCPFVGTDFYEVNAELQTAQAVVPGQGQTVNIAGVKVGEVGYVTLEDGHAVVQMKIRDEVQADLQGRHHPAAAEDRPQGHVPGARPRHRGGGRDRGRRQHAGRQHAPRRERRRDPGRARRRHARLPADPAERGRRRVRRRGHRRGGALPADRVAGPA